VGATANMASWTAAATSQLARNPRTLRTLRAAAATPQSGTPKSRTWGSAYGEAPTLKSSEEDTCGAELTQAVFGDHRWLNAQTFLEQTGTIDRPADIEALIVQGAGAYGIWGLPEHVLEGLVRQIAGKPDIASYAPSIDVDSRVGSGRKSTRQDAVSLDTGKGWLVCPSAFRLSDLALFKLLMTVFVFSVSLVSTLRTALETYPRIVEVFGWSWYVARIGGMATALWSGLLFLSMARTFLTWISQFEWLGMRVHAIIENHKEAHIFFGKAMTISGLLHAIAVCYGPAIGVDSSTHEELNEWIGCANPDGTPGYVGMTIDFLQYPKCPLEADVTYFDFIFRSTPGITGIALTVLMGVVAVTSRHETRRLCFERFSFTHHIAIVSWPILLFCHGANGWMSVGIPVAILTCGFPLFLHCVDRVCRLLRYYLFVGRSVVAVHAATRCGRDGSADGALVFLQISKPPFLWRFRPGMYAFLCMPKCAPLQWHPFTICSGSDDQTVDFLISSVGNWTQALAQQCLDARGDMQGLPVVALDGPYAAPAQSALWKEVFIAVGAGVGITPFFSLLSTLVDVLGEKSGAKLPLKAAHFFWMTRSCEEFLIGKRLFMKIADNPLLQGKLFLHLHVTQKDQTNDGAAFLFREALRRQSVVDRQSFARVHKHLEPDNAISSVIDVPHAWVHGAKNDVIWLSYLLQHAAPAEDKTLWTRSLTSSGELGRVSRVSASFCSSTMWQSTHGGKAQQISPLSDCSGGLVPQISPLSATSNESAADNANFNRSRQDPNRQQPWWDQLPESHGRLKMGKQRDPQMPGNGASAAVTVGADSFHHGVDQDSLDPCTCTPSAKSDSKAPPLTVPVAFGRPDFEKEFMAIGSTRPNTDIHVYVCGGSALVDSLTEISEGCSAAARLRRSKGCVSIAQQYHVHKELFG